MLLPPAVSNAEEQLLELPLAETSVAVITEAAPATASCLLAEDESPRMCVRLLSLESRCNQLVAEVEQARSTNTWLGGENERLSGENERLRNESRALSSESCALRAENARLQGENAQLQREGARLRALQVAPSPTRQPLGESTDLNSRKRER